MCRSDFLTKPGEILFVFLAHESSCLCLLIFGNQLSAVYFWADGMSFIARGVVVTGHSTVPLEGCLSSQCSLPGFAEVNEDLSLSEVHGVAGIMAHSSITGNTFWHQSLI